MSDRKKIILAAAVGLLASALCCAVIALAGAERARVILAAVCTLLMAAIGVMVVLLHDSLRRTLYSYDNIGLIGGIAFASVLVLALLGHFVLYFHDEPYTIHNIYRAIIEFPRQFSYNATFVITAVCIVLGVSNIALIRHEGFCLNNALALLVAGFYIGGTVVAYLISDLLAKYVLTGESAAPVILNTVISLFILLMLCYFECIALGSAVMGWLAAKTKPAYDKDYIIILGCSLDKRGGLLPLLKGRVNRAIRFAWEQEIATGKPMKYVPSGGQGPNEVISEGSAMELYLMTRGAEDYEIFPEKKSKNTMENMVFSKRIIDELNPNAKIAFATTNYHILRSGIIARRAGIDAQGIAGDTKWYFWPNGFVREFFGILALNTRAHIIVAIVTAIVCAIVGAASFFLNLI